MLKRTLAGALFAVLMSGAPAPAADIPVLPYVEVSFATEGELSLFCIPDGTGHPLTAAFDPTGQPVDGTLTIVLYDDHPPWGDPVPNYPREDIWLVDMTGDLVLCHGATVPDADTDGDGRTTFTGPFAVGGHARAADGNRLAVFVAGWILENPALESLRINSADLNGDLEVNLTDVYLFTLAYFGPYDYAADFHWDGVINLSDLAQLAISLGAECP